MGEVGIIYQVMPEDVEVDLEDLKSRITGTVKDPIKLNQIEEKPIAFGLKALHVQVIIDDKKGGADEFEAALSGLAGVQSVEVVHMGLL